jgi:3D-(3,5/4)-trihydroxycyclohexane-1,2-dione acylhydrolase (decyclizing)
MITGAAAATVNRVPVLLVPGDIFARRNVAPVLQQLESEHSQDVSVNDCFKPVSRYWDRINRPDQLLTALPEAMRVLTSPAETGAVTLAFPQDVQTEAFDYPTDFFRERTWHVSRSRPDVVSLQRAVNAIRNSIKPVIVAGGGTIYSEATEALRTFVEATGIPVVETMAGKGSLHYSHPLALSAVGVTGNFAANAIAHDADCVIGIGTRYSDFTTMSKTVFANPAVVFVNINVAGFDAHKHAAIAVVGDAKVTLEELQSMLQGWRVPAEYQSHAQTLRDDWDAEVQRIYDLRNTPLPSQGELLGAVNEHSNPNAVMINAAGSMPGDLHKLWRARNPKNYHLEYGFSTMGYEVAGGLGVKMAAPEREVIVLVGDGSYLMLSQEIVTAVQERQKLIIVLMDNAGYKSIGSLSRSLGQDGFGTRYAYPVDGVLPGDEVKDDIEALPVDLAANARSLGADVMTCSTYDEFVAAFKAAQKAINTTVVYVQNDRYVGVPGYDSWWDVPVAEVSEMPAVRDARRNWEDMRKKERHF